MTELNILEEANNLTGGSGNRAQDYGSVLEGDQRQAALMSALFGVEVKAEHMCLMMILTKISRELHKPKRDNLVDIAGYARCLEVHYAEKGIEGYKDR